MRIWLITIGEPVPFQLNEEERLHRTGFFAKFLAEKGHEVVWWTSAFDHFKKLRISNTALSDTTLETFNKNGVQINAMFGGGYKRNISLSRIKDHKVLAGLFRSNHTKASRPDIIVAALPSIELASEAVIAGRKYGVPVIIDVRDLWPDIFIDILPSILQPLGKVFLANMIKMTKTALSDASGIWGVSDSYLEWGLRYAGRAKNQYDGIFPLGYPKVNDKFSDSSDTRLKLLGKGLDPEKIIVWFIGMFGRSYDLDTVINAAEIMEKNHPEVQFVLSGNGDNFQKISKDAKKLRNVVLTDWLNEHEIAFMMKCANIGLMAYKSGAPQSLPNKFFEFLAAGLPVCSSLSGESSDILLKNNCGVIYKANKAESLAAEIENLIVDKTKLELMSSNAHDLFEREYEMSRINDNMLLKLDTILKGVTLDGDKR